MNKLKTFFRAYFRSITDPTYYRDVLQAPFSFSVKYFVLFFLFLGLVSAVVFGFRDVPQLVDLAHSYVDYVVEEFPADLVLEFKDDQLEATGVTQPFTLPTLAQDDVFGDSYPNLVTINTQSTDYSDALLTFYAEDFRIRFPDQEPYVQTYDQLDLNTVINRDIVVQSQSQIKSDVTSIIQLLPLAVWGFVTVLWAAFVLLYLVLLAALVYLVTQFGQTKLSFTKSYQLCLHTITFAETARFLQTLLFNSHSLPSIYTPAFFGASLLVLISLRRK